MQLSRIIGEKQDGTAKPLGKIGYKQTSKRGKKERTLLIWEDCMRRDMIISGEDERWR